MYRSRILPPESQQLGARRSDPKACAEQVVRAPAEIELLEATFTSRRRFAHRARPTSSRSHSSGSRQPQGLIDSKLSSSSTAHPVAEAKKYETRSKL